MHFRGWQDVFWFKGTELRASLARFGDGRFGGDGEYHGGLAISKPLRVAPEQFQSFSSDPDHWHYLHKPLLAVRLHDLLRNESEGEADTELLQDADNLIWVLYGSWGPLVWVHLVDVRFQHNIRLTGAPNPLLPRHVGDDNMLHGCLFKQGVRCVYKIGPWFQKRGEDSIT